MSEDGTENSICQLLQQIHEGVNSESRAFEELMERTYSELHLLAKQTMKGERLDHTLGASGILHQSLMRLGEPNGLNGVNDKKQLLAAITNLMKNLLIDHARMKKAKRRGGEYQRVSLDKALDQVTLSGRYEMLDLNDALAALKRDYPRQYAVTMLRMFLGMTIRETAAELNVSTTTVESDWSFAKSWLRNRLSG